MIRGDDYFRTSQQLFFFKSSNNENAQTNSLVNVNGKQLHLVPSLESFFIVRSACETISTKYKQLHLAHFVKRCEIAQYSFAFGTTGHDFVVRKF